MATLAVGALVGGKALFEYNRKNYMFDRKLKQVREFQEQNMRVEQFMLYREDVRDLVELTVSKMDLYLVMAALLADRTTVMICKQHEALPKGSPDWAVTLNALSLASGMFYLLLSLWLAIIASVTAQSFGARLLTQFVRLPIVSEEQLTRASAVGTDYEGRDAREMLRVPILQARGRGTRDDDHVNTPASASSERRGISLDPSRNSTRGLGGNTDATGGTEQDGAGLHIVPTGMLQHIQLYRKVQLNWQAYDAYCRVSLFAGTNSLLYSCLYWSLGQFLQNSHATLPALGCSVIFAAVQATLSRLDLKLRRQQVWFLSILLALTPTLTTTGMLLYMDLKDVKAHKKQGSSHQQLKTIIMNICAIGTHVLHTCVALLLLWGSWPDEATGKDALLPGKFRSVLYLDVFGWLLNPDGPGTNDEDIDGDEGDEEDEPPSAPGSRDFELPSSTHRLLHPSGRSLARSRSSTLQGANSYNSIRSRGTSSISGNSTFSESPARRGTPEFPSSLTSNRSGAQELRYGGREAASAALMEGHNAPRREAGASFTDHAPRRVPSISRRRGGGNMPGQLAWGAFCHASFFVVCMWILSALWTIYTTVLPFRDSDDMDNVPFGNSSWLLHAGCSAVEGSPAMQFVQGRHEQTVRSSPYDLSSLAKAMGLRLRDRGCDIRWPTTSTSFLCHNAKLCVVALLRRGGRTITLCQIKLQNNSLMLSLRTTLRVVPGAPSLKSVALGWRNSPAPADSGSNFSLNHLLSAQYSMLRIFARTASNEVLALHLVHSWPHAERARLARPRQDWLMSLTPEFEIPAAESLRNSGHEHVEMEHLVFILTKQSERGAGTTEIAYANLERPMPLLLSIAVVVADVDDDAQCHSDYSGSTFPTSTPSASGAPASLLISLWDMTDGRQETHKISSLGLPEEDDLKNALSRFCSATSATRQGAEASTSVADTFLAVHRQKRRRARAL